MEFNDDHCIANREHGFAIETERLILYPTANESMERLIAAEHDAEMKQAYSEMLQGCVQNPNERIWYAVWYIELKNSPRTIVGDFCFKGLNADGAVEIGYGLYDGCCGRGYMTEALEAVCKWAVLQLRVKRIEAETAPENNASRRVLFRVGFMPTGAIGEEGPRFVFLSTPNN